MNAQPRRRFCCGAMPPLGVFEGKDLAVLDRLAVKLICLDDQFASWLEQIGRLLGYRIAEQWHPTPVSLDAALASLLSSCGLEGPIEPCFLRRDASETVLQITGCTAALGWQIPRAGRAVCRFDAALFEGFLHKATGERAWRVREAACLGFGDAACEFTIHRQDTAEAGSQEIEHHDQH